MPADCTAHLSSTSAGAIAGPLVALLLLARYGIRGVFWAAAVPGALAVLVAWWGIRETKSHVSQNRRDVGHPTLEKSPLKPEAGLNGAPIGVFTQRQGWP